MQRTDSVMELETKQHVQYCSTLSFKLFIGKPRNYKQRVFSFFVFFKYKFSNGSYNIWPALILLIGMQALQGINSLLLPPLICRVLNRSMDSLFTADYPGSMHCWITRLTC